MHFVIALLPMSELLEFFNNAPALLSVVPFLALAVFIVLYGIANIQRQYLRHRERIAMIERGMHPDHPPESSDPQNQG